MQRVFIAKAISTVGIPLAAGITAAQPVLEKLPTWTEHYEIIQWAFGALCAIVGYAFVVYINSQIRFNNDASKEFSKIHERVDGLSSMVHEIKGRMAHD